AGGRPRGRNRALSTRHLRAPDYIGEPAPKCVDCGSVVQPCRHPANQRETHRGLYGSSITVCNACGRHTPHCTRSASSGGTVQTKYEQQSGRPATRLKGPVAVWRNLEEGATYAFPLKDPWGDVAQPLLEDRTWEVVGVMTDSKYVSDVY